MAHWGLSAQKKAVRPPQKRVIRKEKEISMKENKTLVE
jgi:hypothetical protein